MPVIVNGLQRIVERGLIDPVEWEKIKREEAMKVHMEIMRATNDADEDPQIGFNYKKNWRTGKLPMKTVFGSDYDYWEYVVNDALRLWRNFSGRIPHDFIAESIANKKGKDGWESIPFYQEGVQLWQNGNPVSFGAKLTGPRVDFGPTADFSAFLERWNYGSPLGPVPVFWGVGVMNAIARQLQADYAGIHTIFMMPIQPNDRSEVRETPNRNNPVRTLPIIRIVPRHYQKSPTRR